MSSSNTFSFKILYLDRFFQGVHKDNGNIYFIPKTLPGEEGIAVIKKQKKGVIFAQMLELTVSSPQRQKPACPHFEECNGCHALHMNYEDEIETKKTTLTRAFHSWFQGEIKTLTADRSFYRNRIQLHFDREQKKLGFKNEDKIMNAPNCLLGSKQITQKLKELFDNDSWLNLTKSPQGEIELYETSNQVSVSLNQGKAHLGFSQVNHELNNQLKRTLNAHSLWQKIKEEKGVVVDLFGGFGNLSSDFDQNHVWIYDVNGDLTHPHFIKTDLYKAQPCSPQKKCDLLIVNPPRAGFNRLNEWVAKLNPTYIAYMSCDFMTQKRDLTPIIPSYQIQELWLIDFFPMSYHFESLVLLQRCDISL